MSLSGSQVCQGSSTEKLVDNERSVMQTRRADPDASIGRLTASRHIPAEPSAAKIAAEDEWPRLRGEGIR